MRSLRFAPIFRKALLAAALTCLAAPAVANVITDWDAKAVAVAAPAPLGQRELAMVHVAMFDAVNSIERRYRPYLVQLTAQKTTSQEAAAAAAAATVLIGLHPEAAEELKAALATYLATIADGEAKSDGIKLGEAVAAKVLQARANDGANAADAYRPKTKPGVYVPTPITVASVWPDLAPFALAKPSQFRPQPPISLESKEWAADFNELKAYGGKTSTKRSTQQTETARFWLCAGLSPGPAPARHGKADERYRQRAVHGALCGRLDRRLYRRVRRQVSLRVLAPDHRDPQRRHQRQPGYRA